MDESKLLIEATEKWFQNSGMTIHGFQELLLPKLEAAGLIDAERFESGTDAESYTRARKAAGVMLGRILRGTSHLPLSWKWAWIAILPPEYQTPLKRDLQALSGCLHVSLPEQHKSGGVKSRLGALTQEFGEALTAAEPAHDGRFDESDSQAASDRYIDELIDVAELVMEEIRAVNRGTGCQGRRHRLNKLMQTITQE